MTPSTELPPKTWKGTIVRLGPGMITAGSIVGSGELIATTNVGAESGFWLLWIIIIGCLIKVFAQVELGRYTLTYRQTPLTAFNSVPGPRWIVNWIIWLWTILVLLVITQQGGIVGSVGQALTVIFPITENGKEYNRLQNEFVSSTIDLALFYKRHPQLKRPGGEPKGYSGMTPSSGPGQVRVRLQELRHQAHQLERRIRTHYDLYGEPRDPYLWATILAVVTSVLLYAGRYGFIQMFSLTLVVLFTFVTIATATLLQTTEEWRITAMDLIQGISFRLPPAAETLTRHPLATALFTFGMIGVSAMELIAYPYWCLEKGYGRFTGPRDGTEAWTDRARGWLGVLRLDAFVSMVVYTTATIAFFLLGAAVLGRVGLIPEGGDMIRTLSEMYVPIFGAWSQSLFLVGAFAVLYSTFFIAAASLGRMISDALGLFGLIEKTDEQKARWATRISVCWPLLAVAVYWIVGWLLEGQSPKAMVLASGAGQAIMLPMLGSAVLYFRYRRCDENLKPGIIWDCLLWVSVAGFTLAGGWALYSVILEIGKVPGSS